MGTYLEPPCENQQTAGMHLPGGVEKTFFPKQINHFGQAAFLPSHFITNSVLHQQSVRFSTAPALSGEPEKGDWLLSTQLQYHSLFFPFCPQNTSFTKQRGAKGRTNGIAPRRIWPLLWKCPVSGIWKGHFAFGHFATLEGVANL